MERVTNHERPGVYSAYTAMAAAQRGNRRGVAAVVAVSQKGTAGTLYALGSYRQTAETFGAEDGLTALVKILLANGAARVLAVPVADESGYAAAFAGGRERCNLRQREAGGAAEATGQRDERVGGTKRAHRCRCRSRWGDGGGAGQTGRGAEQRAGRFSGSGGLAGGGRRVGGRGGGGGHLRWE